MKNKKFLFLSIGFVLVMAMIISGGSFAYFQWSMSYNKGTGVNVTIEMGGIKMHIEPEETGFVGLYPVYDCNNKYSYGDALVTIENNTGTVAVPSFVLKAKASRADSEEYNFSRHIHYAVVALGGPHKGRRTPEKGNPIGGNILDGYVTGACDAPLSVSDTFVSGDVFSENYGLVDTGTFGDYVDFDGYDWTLTTNWRTFPMNYPSGTYGADDTGSYIYLPRSYDSITGNVQGVTFKAEPYTITKQWYRVYVWVDHEYTTTIIDDNVSMDPLQNLKIEISWSENSMLQQVSGASNVEEEEDFSSGLYDLDGNIIYTWDELLASGDIVVEGTTITDSNKNLTGHLVIPEGITMIGEYAFGYYYYSDIDGNEFEKPATNISAVTLPDSLTEIGFYAFYSADSLSEVHIGSNSHITTISDMAFNGTSIEKIIIPSSVEYIYSNAFDTLKEVIFAENSQLTYIGGYVFSAALTTIKFNGTITEWNSITKDEYWDETILITYVQCLDGVVTLREPGLYYYSDYTSWDDLITAGDIIVEGTTITDSNKNLTGNLVIPSWITEIGYDSFADSSLSSVYFSPNSQLTLINQSAFEGSDLNAINIPASVTEIYFAAFYGCDLGENLTFEDGSQLLWIPSYSFYNSGVTSVVIPNNITSIGDSAFIDCPLNLVIFKGTMAEWELLEISSSWKDAERTVEIRCNDGILYE